MELRTFQIDLDSLEEIKPQQLPFDIEAKEAELEYFARSVIKLGGLLRIPVVERTGIESYRLVEGHFDYLAYLKAREIDPDLPDRIRVFIMEKDNSEPIQTQLNVLRDLELSNPTNPDSLNSNDRDNSFKDLQVQVNSLKLLVETELKKLGDILEPLLNPSKTNVEIKQLLEDLRAEVVALGERLPRRIKLLSTSQNEILNALIEAGIKEQYANAASQAIQYWKDSDRELTWTNLKKSTTGTGDHRIANFGAATFRKLQEIAEIK